MALRIRTTRSPAEFATALGAIGHYFGGAWTNDDAERFARLLPVERMHAALGGAGVFPFELSVPGAQTASCARSSPTFASAGSR